jgi:hypothetical protein
MTLHRLTDEMFLSHVVRGEGCWEWIGNRNSSGYGITRGRIRAHRMSYELFCSPIPVGALVLHRCDNPPCVRPDHLFLGTQQDNMSDMIAKRRHWVWRRPGNIPRGESHHNSTLRVEQMRAIRFLRLAGASSRQVARAFAMSKTNVLDICSGRSWSSEPYLLPRKRA